MTRPKRARVIKPLRRLIPHPQSTLCSSKVPKSSKNPKLSPTSTNSTSEPKVKAEPESEDDDVIYLGTRPVPKPKPQPVEFDWGLKLPPIREQTSLDILAAAALRHMTPYRPQPVEPFTWTTADSVQVRAMMCSRSVVVVDWKIRRILGI
ncbi:hypothetical protein M434DRAFT_35574 [Hypoxylon sp. CO27-5]|nr:hypothetical protein M434DRAFT_35574 [Hypoxylon sp. CO27-5]